MSILLILVPLILAIGLILVRLWELKVERTTFITLYIRKIDPTAKWVVRRIDNMLLSSTDVAHEAKKSVARRVWQTLSHGISAIKHVIDIAYDRIHGKKNLKEEGMLPFSFSLCQIIKKVRRRQKPAF